MRRVFMALTCFMVGVWFVWSDGNVAADFQLRSQNLTPALISTSERECTTTNFIFQNCSFSYQLNGSVRQQNYYFFVVNSPKRLVMLEGKNRNQVTSSVGQDFLSNRILAVIVFPLFGVFLLLKGKGHSRSEPVRRAAEARQPVMFGAGDHPTS